MMAKDISVTRTPGRAVTKFADQRKVVGCVNWGCFARRLHHP